VGRMHALCLAHLINQGVVHEVGCVGVLVVVLICWNTCNLLVACLTVMSDLKVAVKYVLCETSAFADMALGP
jgi:hypothetical protein